MLIFSELKSL